MVLFLATVHSETESVLNVTAQNTGISTEVPLLSSISISGTSSVLSAGPSALPSSVVSAPFPVMGLSSPPAAYPTQVTSIHPAAEYAPPTFPAELTSPPQSILLPGSSYTASTTSTVDPQGYAAPNLPPPPTMGFVPSHGIVTGHPSKVSAVHVLRTQLF